jgi:hypothetical protein
METQKGMAMNQTLLQTVPRVFTRTVEKNRDKTALRYKNWDCGMI